MTTDLLAAVTQAEDRALADHVAGVCGESEWSCGACEVEATPSAPAPGPSHQEKS